MVISCKKTGQEREYMNKYKLHFRKDCAGWYILYVDREIEGIDKWIAKWFKNEGIGAIPVPPATKIKLCAFNSSIGNPSPYGPLILRFG